MSEDQVRAIVIREIKSCFEQISKDVAELKNESRETHSGIARIERLLKGDREYGDDGLAIQMQNVNEYVKKNTDIKLAERGMKAIEHFEMWEKQGLWKTLTQMAEGYNVLKWFVAFTGIGTITGIINIVTMFINHI